MLNGSKALAIFHDIVKEGYKSPEEFIPENAFAPHVASGKIKRFTHDVIAKKDNSTIRFVYFTLPGEEWRAQFMIWMNDNVISGQMKHEPAYDVVIGRLLGYTESDAQHFVEHSTKLRAERHKANNSAN